MRAICVVTLAQAQYMNRHAIATATAAASDPGHRVRRFCGDSSKIFSRSGDSPLAFAAPDVTFLRLVDQGANRAVRPCYFGQIERDRADAEPHARLWRDAQYDFRKRSRFNLHHPPFTAASGMLVAVVLGKTWLFVSKLMGFDIREHGQRIPLQRPSHKWSD